MGVHLPPFQSLVDAHWYDVARLAHALAGPQDGPDVAQQAWVQAYAAYPSLRSARNLRGWLLTITHRCAMDGHRARARRPVAVPDTTLAAGMPPVSAAEAPDDAVWGRVAALPGRQRSAVVLRFVGDLDHAQIAAALGTTAETSRRLLSDALATLRKDLS
ncbi:MAG TPA: sigma-70 family RNA polymerase sigma factor [Candidatus Lustribacter sp.]|nr:sigma-70 family RNA polymerase sigma factor [Candidatus Lustribacter sp.]